MVAITENSRFGLFWDSENDEMQSTQHAHITSLDTEEKHQFHCHHSQIKIAVWFWKRLETGSYLANFCCVAGSTHVTNQISAVIVLAGNVQAFLSLLGAARGALKTVDRADNKNRSFSGLV